MRKILPVAVGLFLAIRATPILAADNGIYIGASVGQSGVQDDSIGFDASATGFKGIIGWRSRAITSTSAQETIACSARRSR